MGVYLQIKARPHEVQKFSAPTSNQLYHYWTLQQKGWFRVLVIEPSLDPDERISCSLLHRPLEHNTRYEALSYTWGDEKAEYPILIDGGVFYVRRNLYCALRELRPAHAPRALWIDAICINQNDVPERGFQVAQMGDVYSLAERVVVWLGEGNEHSDLGFEALAEYFRISGAACKAAAPGTDSPDAIAQGVAAFLAHPAAENRLIGIIALYIRPWWRRVWTVQEIGLAREAEVQCGSRSIAWERLHLFSTTMMMQPVQDLLAQYTPRSEIGRSTLKLLRTHTTMRAHSMENTRAQLMKGKLSLSLLARVTLQRLATDPRDKIYGLLGMAENDIVLQPDYTLPVADVYTATTMAMLLQNKDLRIFTFLLYSDTDRDVNLPSWAVDFRNLNENKSLATISGFLEGQSPQVYSAAPTVGPDAFFTSDFENNRLLRLKGAELDVVRTIGNCATFPGLEKIELAQKPLLSTITQWKDGVTPMKGPYTTGESSMAAFWKTLLIGRKVAGYHSGFSGLVSEVGNIRLDSRDSSIPPRTLDEEKLLAQALVSPSGQMSHLWNRRFAVSEKGYFTLLPGIARKGDILCVFVGGEVPYILRPLANGNFQMLGECYVHGMMDGEVAGGVEKGEFTYRHLTLE